jgi:hypothetical protein
MEAASVGRPIVSIEGTAFESQIEYFNLGWVCKNTHEIAERILTLSEGNNENIQSIILHARERFISDTTNANKNFIK